MARITPRLEGRKAALLSAAGCAALLVAAAAPAGADARHNSVVIGPVDDAVTTSIVTVGGMSGVVTGLTVSLHQVDALSPDDMDVLLIGPDDTRVVLMSDACGERTGLKSASLIFDGSSRTPLPNDGPCSTGTYAPSDWTDASADPWAGLPVRRSLSAFDGIDPNGTWKLVVGDDSPSGLGTHGATAIAGGWTLDITTGPARTRPLCQGEAVTVDLASGELPTAGPDVIRGTPGNDVIDGSSGDDVICGLGGDDWIMGGAGDDRMDAGAGIDLVSYASASDPVHVRLGASAPQNTGLSTGTDTLRGFENVVGGTGNDILTGTAGSNVLSGSIGDDVLVGAAGDDTLVGGDGSDRCNGGDGTDTATTCETLIGIP